MNKKHGHKMSIYRRRKIWFWSIVAVIAVLCLLIYMFTDKVNVDKKYIRVAACGCVKQRAVYTMREGSDLAMLVRMANGFTLNADVTRVNLDMIVKNDSVYHLPCKGNSSNSLRMSFIQEVNKTIRSSYKSINQEVVAEAKEKDIQCYSILYVGLPAVFVLINYYPEFHRINFVHIPHSTLFLHSEYRVIDMFFVLDIYPTMRIVERSLKQKIDFYMIQDRFNFIDLINLLGGVDINLDEPYAEEYDLKPGKNVIDGFYAWEYIRFVDWRNITMTVKSEKKKDLVRKDNFVIDPATTEMLYEMRNQRQRRVLEAMRTSFKNLSSREQLKVIDNFKNVFRTDMKPEFLAKVYKDILVSPKFSYGSLPGYFEHEKGKLFFYPDLPTFERLRKAEIRRNLEKRTNKEQVFY